MSGPNTTRSMYAGGILALVVAAGIFFVLFGAAPSHPFTGFSNGDLVSTTSTTGQPNPSGAPAVTDAGSLRLTTTPGQERWYTNTTLNYSFRLPDGFLAPEIETHSPHIYGVKVKNENGDMLLAYAFPITSGTALTEEGIRANSPGENISNVHQVIVGTLVKGLAFNTDAPEWGGDGIAFWFPYNGYLYEVESYRKDASLMDFVLSSWRFAPPTPPRIP